MLCARERDPETSDARFDVQEWLFAVLILGALLLAGMGVLGVVYVLVSV